METNNNNQMAPAQPQTFAINYFDAKQFETVQRVCKLFANSELVPDMYKASKVGEGKAIANCVIAIEMANRIGASPLMIMQNMVPIYGRPSWSASFLIATVNSCGRFKPLKYRFTEKGMLGMVDLPGGKQYDGRKIMDVECVAYTTEKESDELLESSPISIRLAILEGWYTKNGSKWQTMPRQMLQYRAAAFWTRAYAPELSMGMRTTDEWQDIQEATYTEVSESVEKEIEEQANTVEMSMEEAPAEDPTPHGDDNNNEPAPKEVVDEETGEVTVVENKPADKTADGNAPETQVNEDQKPRPLPYSPREPRVQRTQAKPASNGASQAHIPDF